MSPQEPSTEVSPNEIAVIPSESDSVTINKKKLTIKLRGRSARNASRDAPSDDKKQTQDPKAEKLSQPTSTTNSTNDPGDGKNRVRFLKARKILQSIADVLMEEPGNTTSKGKKPAKDEKKKKEHELYLRAKKMLRLVTEEQNSGDQPVVSQPTPKRKYKRKSKGGPARRQSSRKG